MNSLLPPNTTAMEHRLEQVTARLGELPAPLRDMEPGHLPRAPAALARLGIQRRPLGRSLERRAKAPNHRDGGGHPSPQGHSRRRA